MRVKYKYLFFIFIIASIALIGALVARHLLRGNVKPESFTGTVDIGAKIDNVHYTSAKKGRIEWVLDAKSATRYKKGGFTALDAVKLVYYTRSGSSYTLTSKEALYNETTGELDASGNVYVISSDSGYSLRTERLKYNMKAGRITSSERVEINTAAMNAVGEGLLIDVELEKLVLLRAVRAQFAAGKSL